MDSKVKTGLFGGTEEGKRKNKKERVLYSEESRSYSKNGESQYMFQKYKNIKAHISRGEMRPHVQTGIMCMS